MSPLSGPKSGSGTPRPRNCTLHGIGPPSSSVIVPTTMPGRGRRASISIVSPAAAGPSGSSTLPRPRAVASATSFQAAASRGMAKVRRPSASTRPAAYRPPAASATFTIAPGTGPAASRTVAFTRTPSRPASWRAMPRAASRLSAGKTRRTSVTEPPGGSDVTGPASGTNSSGSRSLKRTTAPGRPGLQRAPVGTTT